MVLGGCIVRGRVMGVLLRPRKTMGEIAVRPSWAGGWLVILGVWALCGGWLLSTPLGQQALVDERVRSIEAFGGLVSDADYAALRAHPPWWVYFVSGGRLLLAPPVTLLVAVALWMACRPAASFVQALAVTVAATTILALGQVVATPFHYVRESLTSPVNLSVLTPMLDEGTLPARALGAIDVFTLWWIAVLAVGGAALTHRAARTFFVRALGLYVGIAALVAVAQIVVGGS
jgi:hypothetical protein